MKKIILIILLLVAYSFNANAAVKCYIKVGFSDCINCYNVLVAVKNFEKVYIFKGEFKGMEKDILKEYLGVDDITNNFISSDSIYQSFGGGDFTVLKFMNNNFQLLKCKMSEIGIYYSKIQSFNKNDNPFILNKDSNPFNLNNNDTTDISKFWHSKCQIKINKKNEIIILDQLLNKVTKLDSKGNKINSFSSNSKLTEEIYISKFGVNSNELAELNRIGKIVGLNAVIINFNKILIFKNEIYVFITGHNFTFSGKDTIYSSFISIVILDENFNFKIKNIESEIDENYFLHNIYVSILNDSLIRFSVACINTEKKPYLIANCKLVGNTFRFTHFLNDVIPENLVDKKLNYTVTNFSYDSEYLAFNMFNKIYKNNIEIKEIHFFNNYTFTQEFPDPPNLFIEIKKYNNQLFILYKLENKVNLVKYSLENKSTSKPVFSLYNNTMSDWPQLDYYDYVYYVTTEKKLIKIKI